MTMMTMAGSVAGYGSAGFFIDADDERLFGPHGPVRLGNKAFQVLLRLVQRGGRLVTKDELMSSVWDGTIVSEFSLTSAIKELRRALGDDARAPRFIESVYGRGYRLLSPIPSVDTTAGESVGSVLRWSGGAGEAAPHGTRPAGGALAESRPAPGRAAFAGVPWKRLVAIALAAAWLGPPVHSADGAGSAERECRRTGATGTDCW